MNRLSARLLTLTLILGFAILTPHARAGVDAWPLFEVSERGTTVVYPFYVHEGNFLMIFPFYYRTNEGRDQHFVWPLVKISDGRPTRIAPVWFSGNEGEFTLFPLIWQDHDYTFWSVPPIYMRRDGAFKAVFPFWARGRESWFVFPSLYREKSADLDQFMIFPLYNQKYEPKSNERSLWALPYYQESSNTWACNSIFPLWYAGSNPQQAQDRTLWLLPYFHKRRTDSSEDWLFPLFHWETSNTESYNYDNQTKHSSMTPTGRQSSLNVLWPLYQRDVKTDLQGKVVSRYRRFLLFSDEIEADGKREFSVLGIPIAERH